MEFPEWVQVKEKSLSILQSLLIPVHVSDADSVSKL